MSIGGSPAVAGSIALGDTVDEVLYNGNECDKVILDEVVVWERNYTLTGTATYSPLTKKVTYSVNKGDLDTWSYRAVKTGGDTGEIAVSSGTTATSGVLGVSEDGTWTVTFKGFKSGVEKATATATVVVATPFVEITSVQELAPTAPPSLAVGTTVGVVVSIDHQDRNDDEDSDCYTQSVFFNDFDTLGMGSKISGLPPGNYVLPYLNHPTAYWYYSASNVWNGVGEVGDCVGDNNANLEHTATMDGVTYKIRYRQILNSSVPSGLSLDVSDSQVNQVTSSTSDQYHSFLSAAYMQAFRRTADSSRNYNYIEAYIHSVS